VRREGADEALRSSSDALSSATIGASQRFVNLSGRRANRRAVTCTSWTRTVDRLTARGRGSGWTLTGRSLARLRLSRCAISHGVPIGPAGVGNFGPNGDCRLCWRGRILRALRSSSAVCAGPQGALQRRRAPAPRRPGRWAWRREGSVTFRSPGGSRTHRCTCSTI